MNFDTTSKECKNIKPLSILENCREYKRRIHAAVSITKVKRFLSFADYL